MTYPVVIIQDRYQGTYSGGEWVAIAGDGMYGDRLDLLKALRAFDGDTEAMEFWQGNVPDWVAVGDTPDVALANLKRKAEHDLFQRINPDVKLCKDELGRWRIWPDMTVPTPEELERGMFQILSGPADPHLEVD